MEVAIKAAKEVQADTLAPELYRLAQENGSVARHEYKFKNFEKAKKYSDVARDYAEKAEFEALRNGAKRDLTPADPLAIPSYAPADVTNPNGNPNGATATGSKSSSSSGSSSSSSPSSSSGSSTGGSSGAGTGGSVPTIQVPGASNGSGH